MRRIEFTKIYDVAFDLANICVEGDFIHNKTVVIDEGFLIDFDIRDRPVAIEMIRCSKMFKLLPEGFSPAIVEGSIIVTRDNIRIEMKIPKKSRFLEREVPNDYGIFKGEFTFLIGENVV